MDLNIGGRRLGPLDLVTHPDTNPIEQSLTLVIRREPVFSKGNSYQVFCYIQGGAEDWADFCVRIIQQKVTSHPVEIKLNSRLVGDERWRLDA